MSREGVEPRSGFLKINSKKNQKTTINSLISKFLIKLEKKKEALTEKAQKGWGRD